MSAFPKLSNMDVEEKLEMRTALLEYCKLDTLAMVEILKKLTFVNGSLNFGRKKRNKSDKFI